MARSVDGFPDPTDIPVSALAKSRSTRRRILEAATAVLAEEGYGPFSTNTVAARAKLTRPAMLYHYPSREQLLVATVYHIIRRRIEAFEAMVDSIASHPPERQLEALHGYFVSLCVHDIPEYLAFNELTMSTRTQPELGGVMRQAVAAYEQARLDITERIPVMASENFRRRVDVLTTLAEGIQLPMRMIDDHDARHAAVRRFLAFLATHPQSDAFFDAADEEDALRPWPARGRANGAGAEAVSRTLSP